MATETMTDIDEKAACYPLTGELKSKQVVVIDKSASSPPTLEHHLAMHLWMGWIGLYVIVFLAAAVAGFTYSAGHFFGRLPDNIIVSVLPNKFDAIDAKYSAGNGSCHFPYNTSCYNYGIAENKVISNAESIDISTISKPFVTLIIDISVRLSQWAIAICGSLSLLTIIISAIAPLNKHGSPNPKWCLSIGNWIMNRGAEYFKLKVVLEDYEAMRISGETGQPAIFVLEPHDVLPVSIFSLCDFLGALPGKRRLIGCISSACFRVPLMRHVWSWVCAESVDRGNVVRLLKEGVSVCLCPGGVREVIHMGEQQVKRSKTISNKSYKNQKAIECVDGVCTVPKSKSQSAPIKTAGEKEDKDEEEDEDEQCVLYLRSRKGFVRLALQHGCPLVPMFTFGQREVLVPWFCTNRCEGRDRTEMIRME
jgi:Diacylglycerol acyltransferase